jgi:nitrogen fixation protein NifB
MSDQALDCLKWAADLPLRPTENRPHVAVASREGVLVNQHLGEASRLHVFRKACGEFELIDRRCAPPRGGGEERWKDLARSLRDCRALLVAGVGNAPRSVLADEGIRVVVMEGLVEEGLKAVYRGGKIRAPLRSEHQCGSGCAGNGMGCM